MCLTVRKKLKEWGYNIFTLEVLLNKYSKTSNKDIIVYKVLELIHDKSDILLRTPYQYTNVDKNGDILISNDLSFGNRYSLIDIYKGIHAFTNFISANFQKRKDGWSAGEVTKLLIEDKILTIERIN